jgi:hypothetical protein
MKSGMVKWSLGISSLAVLMFVAFFAGRKTASPTVKTFSDLSMFTTGKRAYLVDTEAKCPNGKSLGRVQVDLDLTTGKWKVVRNDPGKEPSCVN